jgi:hypothetical protein
MRVVPKYIAHGIQFVVTHVISRTEIPALLYSWDKNTPSVKMLCLPITACPYIFVKTLPAYMFVYYGYAKFFLSPMKLCICGL